MLNIQPFLTGNSGSFDNIAHNIQSTSGEQNRIINNTQGLSESLTSAFQEQAKLQEQQQRISILANVLKSMHDMMMSVIRNLRVSG